MPGPTSERPVGGSLARVVSVVRPPRRHLRAYAALAPKAVMLARARARRRRLSAVPIAVTGSVGKTTTKNLLEAALRTVGPTVAGTGSNRARGLARTIARADRSTEFLIQEIGAAYAGRGSLDELLWALEPRVAIVTTVLGDHLASFGSLDDTAKEKGKAVSVLPPSGLAVLNADDERVRDMATRTEARVLLVGRTSDAAVRIEDVTLDTVGRLRLHLSDNGIDHILTMQLLGLHWALATALAFATATRLGAHPQAAIQALESVAPTPERLSIVTTATGACFLLETAKASEATIDHAFAAFLAVPAARRTVVIGRLDDYTDATPAQNVSTVADKALTVADEVMLCGHSARVAGEAVLAHPRVRSFDKPRELTDDLWSRLEKDDLVLVFGEHLARIGLRATHDVRCWIDDCNKRGVCSTCPLLGPPLA